MNQVASHIKNGQNTQTEKVGPNTLKRTKDGAAYSFSQMEAKDHQMSPMSAPNNFLKRTKDAAEFNLVKLTGGYTDLRELS